MAASTGATLTSFTVMVMVSSSKRLGEPLSVTRTVTVKLPGPWASVGVQVKTTVVGWMLAPAGAPLRLKVRVLAGRSGSVAVAGKLSMVSSSTVGSAMDASSGGRLTSDE